MLHFNLCVWPYPGLSLYIAPRETGIGFKEECLRTCIRTRQFVSPSVMFQGGAGKVLTVPGWRIDY